MNSLGSWLRSAACRLSTPLHLKGAPALPAAGPLVRSTAASHLAAGKTNSELSPAWTKRTWPVAQAGTLAIKAGLGGQRSWSACWYFAVWHRQPARPAAHRPITSAQIVAHHSGAVLGGEVRRRTSSHRRQPTVYQAPPPEYGGPFDSSEERRRVEQKSSPPSRK